MSEASEKPSTGIKRLEKKEGRLWGFISRKAEGVVEPLSPLRMAQRLRDLLTSSVKTTSSYMKSKMGEGDLRSMFEYQGVQFAEYMRGQEKLRWRADQIAMAMIKLNFQPLGMEAEYSGDADVATIVVTSCPLPQMFIQRVDFLTEYLPSQKPILEGFGDTLPTKGEWPPRSVEVCAFCRIVTPKIGEKIGFTWEHSLKKDERPVRCCFTIKVRPREQG